MKKIRTNQKWITLSGVFLILFFSIFILCRDTDAMLLQTDFGSDLPDWDEVIQPEHPRLFFNQKTLPDVRQRALGKEKEWYDKIYSEADNLRDRFFSEIEKEEPEIRDLGYEAAFAAFVFLVTKEPVYYELANLALEISIRYYEHRYDKRLQVAWTSTSRLHAVMAWDWLRNDMEEARSNDLMSRFLRVVKNSMENINEIDREHLGSYRFGFYGLRNLEWYMGVTAYGTGIEPELVNEFINSGYLENKKMLDYRNEAAGRDGGGSSTSINYTFGRYPTTEHNFLHTWFSATGENKSEKWPNLALFANYVIWNWIETAEGPPLDFGYGDSYDPNKIFPISRLYTHLANLSFFYGEINPEAVALARYVQEKLLPKDNRNWSADFFIYPFLINNLKQSSEPVMPENMPLGRHFENMGQIFMRSGLGPDDTYAMFACGGIISQHEHYDALHFTIYHKGYLALDSGTRYRQYANGQHLANYFPQTVAHNNILVHQPGEPPANYWGGTVEKNYGGQHQHLASDVKAFESGEGFVYVAGDGTRAYLHGNEAIGEKVSEVTRQIVYIAPRWFVIFDRVTSTDSSYRKEWLLHTADEPKLEGDRFMVDHGNGRLIGRTLLPADAEIEKLGGPGKEFWAAGQNWEIDRGTLTDEQLALMGWGRLVVSPESKRNRDLFLHILEVGEQNQIEGNDLESAMIVTELVKDSKMVGVHLILPDDEEWEIRFTKSGKLSGHIRRFGSHRPELDRALSSEVQPQIGISGFSDSQ